MPDTYTEWQTREILQGLGVDIRGETQHDFTVLCPFHGNRYSPSLSVSKIKGSFVCFNPSCAESGSIVDMVKRLSKRNDYEALRYVIGKRGAEPDLEAQIMNAMEPDTKGFVEFPQEVIDKCFHAMADETNAHLGRAYMHGRGFTEETLKYFKVGFSAANEFHPDMITVPMHDPDGMPVGFVGRGIHDKVFKNSGKLPTSRTWFNLHRAKRSGSTAIITEASFDAMRIWQAGFSGVIANLGGHLNAEKVAMLDRYFTKLIIATDMDDLIYNNKNGNKCRVCINKGIDGCEGHNPGRDLGETIAKALPHKDIWWAVDSYQTIYPHGAKDVGDLTDDEIKHVIKNAIPTVEYIDWNVY